MKSLSIDKFIQSMLVLYLIAWSISPPLQIDTIYRIAALGCAILWFILNIPYQVKFERIHTSSLMFLLLVVFVALFQYKGNLDSILKPINYYILVLAFLIAYCYKDRWEELELLIPIVLILFIYFNYKSNQAVVEDPTIARLIVRDDPEIYPYMRSGVGGYNLLYPQVCVLPMLVSWMLGVFRKSKIKFVIGVLWLISYVVFLLNSGYSIALVTSIASLIILFFYKRKSVTMAIIITALLIVLLVWLIGYVDGFRNSLLTFFDGTKVARKIEDIYLSITTDNTADSIMMRTERYKYSIQTIFNYPIIGGLWWDSGGGHSALLDTFAKYGLFGGYIFVCIIFGFPMILKKSENKKDIKLGNALIISILLVVLLDSLSYNFVFTILLLTPMCYHNISVWRNDHENTLDSKPSAVASGETVKN